jgi:hypothetical protein
MLAFMMVALTAGCAGAPEPGASGSGIAGRVVASASCPGGIEDPSCPRKGVQTMVAIESADGERLVRVRTDAVGSFRVDLPPGDYLLSAQPPPSQPHLVPRPASTKVEPGAHVRVTVFLDLRPNEP